MNEIVIYKSMDNQIEIKVQFEKDSVWLSQKLMAELFDKDTDTIGMHLKNIYTEGELIETSTTEFFSVVQNEGSRQVTRKIKYYNLDTIISVGYRVNSKKGIQFRQWATQRLKDYLVKGYALNQQRLDQLNHIVNVIQQTGSTDTLQMSEAKGLLHILSTYTRSFILLNRYDSNSLSTNLDTNITYEINYIEAKAVIKELKQQLIDKKKRANCLATKKTKV